MKGLTYFIHNGSAPGWGSLTREDVRHYIRTTGKYPDIDVVIKDALELSKTTDSSDDEGWTQIANLLEDAVGLLEQKLVSMKE